MSGAELTPRGLLVIPRVVAYNVGNETLDRTIEIWLVDASNGTAGADTIRNQGLVIALGFDSKPEVDNLSLTVCMKDDWTHPSQPPVPLDPNHQQAKDFAKGLKDLLGGNCPWKWKAWFLDSGKITAPIPAKPECEADLVTYRVKNFKPNKARGFHVVPVVIATPGTDPASHYVLGLGVYTQSKDASVTVHDFMTLAYEMHAPDRPALPQKPACP